MDFKKLGHYLLTTRPYSYVDIILVSIVAYILAAGSFSLDLKLFYTIIISILWWMFVLLIVERRKNGHINKFSALIPFVPLVILVAIKSLMGVVLVLASVPFLYLYGLKSKNKFFGYISPLTRAIQTLLLFLIILVVNGGPNQTVLENNLDIILAIIIFVAARNLLGDIRDSDIDKFTLPKTIGVKASYAMVQILIITAIAIIQNIWISFPFIVMLVLIPLMHNGGLSHRIYLIASMFFLMNYIIAYLEEPITLLFLTNLSYIGILLNFTYNRVPRTRNLEKGIQNYY